MATALKNETLCHPCDCGGDCAEQRTKRTDERAVKILYGAIDASRPDLTPIVDMLLGQLADVADLLVTGSPAARLIAARILTDEVKAMREIRAAA